MKKLLLVPILLLLVCSCDKDDAPPSHQKDANPVSETTDNSNSGNNNGESDQGTVDTEIISGTIVFPENSNIDLSTLEVESFIAESTVSNANFTIAVPKEKHTILFVTDSSDEVVLLGYSYPNQTNFDISAESTVIALAMSNPVSAFLDESGKATLRMNIIADSSFPQIVNEMEQLLSRGFSPLDTDQTSFSDNFLIFFNDVLNTSGKSSREDYTKDPVKIHKAGNSITFQNPGKLYQTFIGIYKNNNLIKSIELDRIKFFATSVSQLVNTANNLTTNQIESLTIKEETFEFTEDGKYQIKIRTGFDELLATKDGEFEAKQASINNVTTLAMDVFLSLVPVKPDLQCVQKLLSTGRSNAELIINGRTVGSTSDALKLIYDIAVSFHDIAINSVACMAPNPENKKYLETLKKVFRYFSLLSKIGNLGNTSLAISQWYYDDFEMDLCYEVKDKTVEECGEDQEFPVLDEFLLFSPNTYKLYRIKIGETPLVIMEYFGQEFEGYYGINDVGTSVEYLDDHLYINESYFSGDANTLVCNSDAINISWTISENYQNRYQDFEALCYRNTTPELEEYRCDFYLYIYRKLDDFQMKLLQSSGTMCETEFDLGTVYLGGWSSALLP